MKKKSTTALSKNMNCQSRSWRTAFAWQNYLIIAVAVVLIVVGFTLMLPEVDVRAAPGGRYAPTPGPGAFDPVRIRVAPIPCFIGFVLMVPAILFVPSERRKADEKPTSSVKLP